MVAGLDLPNALLLNSTLWLLWAVLMVAGGLFVVGLLRAREDAVDDGVQR